MHIFEYPVKRECMYTREAFNAYRSLTLEKLKASLHIRIEITVWFTGKSRYVRRFPTATLLQPPGLLLSLAKSKAGIAVGWQGK